MPRKEYFEVRLIPGQSEFVLASLAHDCAEHINDILQMDTGNLEAFMREFYSLDRVYQEKLQIVRIRPDDGREEVVITPAKPLTFRERLRSFFVLGPKRR